MNYMFNLTIILIIILSLSLIVLPTAFSEEWEVYEVNEAPVIITEVELWGPPTEFGKYRYCREVYGGGVIQWIELFNTTNKEITIKGYNVTNTNGSVIHSIVNLELKPQERCLYGIDSIPPQVGPWIPSGTENSSVMFEYFIGEDNNLVSYEYRTPSFTDNHNDTRTWQLVDDDWIFEEMSPPRIKFVTMTLSTADGSIIVELSRPEQFEVPTSARFDLKFMDAKTGKLLPYVKYNFFYTDGDRKFDTLAGPIDVLPSYDNIAINGTSTQYAQFTQEAQNRLTVEITSLGPNHTFEEPKIIEFTNVVVPEFPLFAMIIFVIAVSFIISIRLIPQLRYQI